MEIKSGYWLFSFGFRFRGRLKQRNCSSELLNRTAQQNITGMNITPALVAFSCAVARLSFATVNKIKVTNPPPLPALRRGRLPIDGRPPVPTCTTWLPPAPSPEMLNAAAHRG